MQCAIRRLQQYSSRLSKHESDVASCTEYFKVNWAATVLISGIAGLAW